MRLGVADATTPSAEGAISFGPLAYFRHSAYCLKVTNPFVSAAARLIF